MPDWTDPATLKRGLRKGLRIAADAANVAVQLGSNPSPIGVFSVAAKLANSVIGESRSTPIEGWTSVRTAGLEWAIFEAAKRARLLEERPGTDPANSFWMGTIHGLRFGWHVGQEWIDGPYLEPSATAENGAAALRAFAWSSIGSSIVYGREAGLVRDVATLEPEDVEMLPSALGLEIWQRQAAFLRAGYRCAVLLHGEPGTGKTNVARYIAEQAGGMLLRVRTQEIIGMHSLERVARYLQPSAVIIDDLCRAPKPEGVLDVFDAVTRSTSLVIVTVNDVEKLDPAVYRRFNALDVYEVTKLDDAVLDRMLAGVPEDAAARLRELPVKYVEDYRREAEVFGEAQALASIEQLVARREEVARMSAAASGSSARQEHDLVLLKDASR